MDNEAKNVLASKTVWGGIMMVVSFLLSQFVGVQVAAEEGGEVATKAAESISTGDWPALVSAVVGFALVVWGRKSAKKPVDIIPLRKRRQ